MFKNVRTFLLKYKITIAIVLFFAVIYSLISIVNHYNFRTNAYDLGIYNQAIWHYSQFDAGPNTVLSKHYDCLLGDHFTLLHFIISPLRYLFGTYTLLIFQIMMVLFGGIGIRKLVNHFTKDKWLPELAMIHFFSIWGIYSALAFDYHDNVVAAMFVPWFLYGVFSDKKILAVTFFFLFIFARENMALWMAGIVLGLILMHLKNNKKKQLFLVSLLFISILYFVLTIKVFMPLFIEKKNTYAHLKYTVLGDDLNEYLKTIFTKPRYVFISLLENHTLSKVGYGAKAETLFFFLISGGFAVFYRPQILIMILPVFLQKFLHDQFSKWGINAHYSIEFVPIIAFAFFYWLIHLKQSPVIKRSIAIFFILVTAFATYSSFEKRYSRYFDELSINIFNKKHYSREFDVRKAKKELSNYLPEDAWVTAESDLIPHIAFRNKIYTFRNIGDADYFVYIKNNKQRFPKKELFFKHMKKYIIKNPQWVKHYEGEIIIYKKTGK